MKWHKESVKPSEDLESRRIHGELLALRMEEARAHNLEVLESLTSGLGFSADNAQRGQQFAKFILDPMSESRQQGGRIVVGEPTIEMVQLKQHLYNQIHADPGHIRTIELPDDGEIRIHSGHYNDRPVFLAEEMAMAEGHMVHTLVGSNYDPTEELLKIAKNIR